MTRCVPGDLAMIVRSNAGNEGRLVRVLGAPEPGERAAICPLTGRPTIWSPGDGHAWTCLALQALDYISWPAARPGAVLRGQEGAGSRIVLLDAQLRPLRDGPGEDEVLRRVGLPGGVLA